MRLSSLLAVLLLASGCAFHLKNTDHAAVLNIYSNPTDETSYYMELYSNSKPMTLGVSLCLFSIGLNARVGGKLITEVQILDIDGTVLWHVKAPGHLKGGAGVIRYTSQDPSYEQVVPAAGSRLKKLEKGKTYEIILTFNGKPQVRQYFMYHPSEVYLQSQEQSE